jgi:uncharacterized phage protein (TIGR01671 family)
MRNTKFRVWDENNLEMIYEVGITPEGIPYSIPDYAEASDQFHYYPSCHKMQFTGLYDREGNEIYEGDIVIGRKGWCDGYLRKKYPKEINIICEIRYKRNAFYSHYIKAVKEHEEAERENHYREIIYALDQGFDNNAKSLVVVGNIYENPYLLEGE